MFLYKLNAYDLYDPYNFTEQLQIYLVKSTSLFLRKCALLKQKFIRARHLNRGGKIPEISE